MRWIFFENFNQNSSSWVFFLVFFVWRRVNIALSGAGLGWQKRPPDSTWLMSIKTKFKCLKCNELCCADARNRRHQRYCSKPECRRASKAASQRQWTERPENQSYFKGPGNSDRVRQWRKANPDYQRNKRSAPAIVLQEISITQAVENEDINAPSAAHALQDICMSQPTLVLGFMSVLTGCVLQDDLMDCARSFMRRGLDILGVHVADSDPQAGPCAKRP